MTILFRDEWWSVKAIPSRPQLSFRPRARRLVRSAQIWSSAGNGPYVALRPGESSEARVGEDAKGGALSSPARRRVEATRSSSRFANRI